MRTSIQDPAWYPLVPEGWRMTRIKTAIESFDSGVWGEDPYDDDSSIPVMRSNELDEGGNWRVTTPALRLLSPSEREKARLREGDLLIVKSSGSHAHIGKTAVVTKEIETLGSCFSNFTGRIRVLPYRANGRFLWYFLNNSPGRDQLFYYGTTTTGLINLSAMSIGIGVFALPPLPEQKRIVAYLDASCAAIDAAVAAKHRQIETLNELLKTIIHAAVTHGLKQTHCLRNSEIVCLDQIPVDWQCVALKRIVATKITDGPHETPELADTGAQFISAEAIKDGKIDFNFRRGFISWELHKQYCRKCKPQRGDIFVVKSGATTGNVAYVDVDFEFSIWSPLALIRCDERIAFYKFIYYVLLTDVFRKQVQLSWSFGTQQNIGMRVIERLKVPLPSMGEQKQIAAFLDDELSKSSEIRSNLETQIAILIGYRKSLIHECVTGQRRITEADLKQVNAHG